MSPMHVSVVAGLAAFLSSPLESISAIDPLYTVTPLGNGAATGIFFGPTLRIGMSLVSATGHLLVASGAVEAGGESFFVSLDHRGSQLLAIHPLGRSRHRLLDSGENIGGQGRLALVATRAGDEKRVVVGVDDGLRAHLEKRSDERECLPGEHLRLVPSDPVRTERGLDHGGLFFDAALFENLLDELQRALAGRQFRRERTDCGASALARRGLGDGLKGA